MASSEDQPRSLVDEQPEIVVHVPEAEEHPQAPPIVIEDRPIPWFERSEAPWILLAAVVVLIAGLLLLRPATTDVTAAPEAGGGTSAVEPAAPTWKALALPVPETLRTHTANVDGSVDVLEVARLGPGAAQSYVGDITTADGPTVQEIFSDNAFTISSPTGGTVVAFLPYQAGDATSMEAGQEVTFVGTLTPVPDDFAAMVGAEAASVGALSGVYVRVVPETLGVVIPESETA